MRKNCVLNFEQLDNKILLSNNPWYIDAIKADTVWNSVPNLTSKPVVAVIDSGLDLNHPDLIPNLFHNTLDPIDGIDNDKNGFIDDYTGWNFASYNNVPQDGYYHGTHVAGIISTIGHGNVSILPIKFISDTGVGYVGSAVASINYAVTLKKEGFNIVAINCSFGGVSNNMTSLSNAIKNASDNGIVVVMAAGNNGTNMDVNPLYPGALQFSNSITVGAVNPDLSLAGYSNYGKNIVTVAAPGSSIYSTLPNNSYGYVSGTSMATAVVSGQVGLLKTLGNYTANQIKNAIVNGCDAVSTLIDKIQHGLINVMKSWNILKATKIEIPVSNPAPVSPPQVSITFGSIFVSNKNISGWASLNNSQAKPIIKVYINNVLRYTTVANLYRNDTKGNNGFSIVINRKLLNLRNNRIVVKIQDPISGNLKVAYDGRVVR